MPRAARLLGQVELLGLPPARLRVVEEDGAVGVGRRVERDVDPEGRSRRERPSAPGRPRQQRLDEVIAVGDQQGDDRRHGDDRDPQSRGASRPRCGSGRTRPRRARSARQARTISPRGNCETTISMLRIATNAALPSAASAASRCVPPCSADIAPAYPRHPRLGASWEGGHLELYAAASTYQRWVPGIKLLRQYPGTSARPDLVAGARARRDPRAAGDGLRGARRPAGGHRPLHDDRLPGRLRALRALAGPGARARLLDLAADPRLDHAAAGRRGPGVGDRPGGHARDLRRADRDRPRPRQARLRRRPALQRGAGRLHERPRDHDHRRAAAEAVRLLDRRRLVPRRAEGVRRRPRPDPHRDARPRARGPRASCSCCRS